MEAVATHLFRSTVNALSEALEAGLKPIPSLARLGLPFGLFDLLGSLRLAFVLRQIRDAERAKAQKLQTRLVSEQSRSREARELVTPSLATDIVVICIVVWGGEMICSPWLQYTPGFLMAPHYVLLFAAAQAFINLLPMVPDVSIHTELPLSFFDGLTRAFMLTTANPGYIIKHASPNVRSSPWALIVSSMVTANGGFMLVNLFQMLSPYGWRVKTPPEFGPGGWRTMDLWVAPLITGMQATLTHLQPFWIRYHAYLVELIGSSTMFGSLEWTEGEGGTKVPGTLKPMREADARSVGALILCVLFGYRAIANFGMDWTQTTAALRGKKKRVIRSKHDGKRLSKENITVPTKS